MSTKSLIRRTVGWAAVLLGAVLLVCWCVKDIAAKAALQHRLSAELGVPVLLERVEVQLSGPALWATNCQVAQPEGFGSSPLLDIAELRLAVRPRGLFSRKVRLTDLQVHIRHLNLVRDQQGRLNTDQLPFGKGVSRVLAPPAAEPGAAIPSARSPKDPHRESPADRVIPPAPPVLIDPPPSATNLPSQPDRPTPPAPPPSRPIPKPQPRRPPAEVASPWQFDGIDNLRLTWEQIDYIDLKKPRKSRHWNIEIQDETAHNLRTQEEVKSWTFGVVGRAVAREFLKAQAGKGLDLIKDLLGISGSQEE